MDSILPLLLHSSIFIFVDGYVWRGLFLRQWWCGNRKNDGTWTLCLPLLAQRAGAETSKEKLQRLHALIEEIFNEREYRLTRPEKVFPTLEYRIASFGVY